MKRSIITAVIAVVFVFAVMVGNSQASIAGSLWDPAFGDPAWNSNADNPSLGAPAAAATATFTVNSINFNSGTAVSYDTWLTPGGVSWVNDSSGVKGTFYSESGHTPYVGTFFQFTWQETYSSAVSEQISILHDDGIYLTVDGIVLINSSSPTTAIPSTYSGILSSGTHTFVLNYGAVNGFPEVLTYSSSSAPVPIPAAVWLLGSGLIGLVGLRRKFRK